MAAKKKTKKKKVLSRKTTRKKAAPAKKLAKRKPAAKRVATKKRAKMKPAGKRAAVKASTTRKKHIAAKTAAPPTRQVVSDRGEQRARSGGQSGDLQGLSNVELSNSESVDELLEEGNTFEAEAVRGVEAAGNADEQEVHTHEVPEDDIPGEYLDKD